MHGTCGKKRFQKGTVMKTGSYLLLAILILLLLAGSGCTAVFPQVGAALPEQLTAASTNNTVERVEVFHFHGNRQCASCIAVGDLAEQTVNTSFRNDLAMGRLVFAHVNYELPENADLATKYNVTGSSLWIGVYDSSGFHMTQDLRVWSLISDEEAYSSYLTDLISKRLNGELS